MNAPEPTDRLYLNARDLFSGSPGMTVEAWGSRRTLPEPISGLALIIDRFPAWEGIACAHWRLDGDRAALTRLVIEGGYRLETSPLGGWLALPADERLNAYWLPRMPLLIRSDAQGHILAERKAELVGLALTGDYLAVELRLEPGWQLDGVCWQFPGGHPVVAELTAAAEALERQPWFLWGSKVNVLLPAGLYRFLVHGSIYTDDYVWPRRWRFRSELDALGLYQALSGLALTTGKRIHDLLRRQIVLSVMAAQAEDGGWHHGEWTDLMEVHLRLHNAAMILLEAALEEAGDAAIAQSLERAASFLLHFTDRTDLGIWFLHDSLETSAENMEIMRAQTNTPWIPTRTLGKSPCTKLILNTHLDALVTLERYQALTGDRRHDQALDSALAAARGILALRPAQGLYRALYQILELSLLPKARAQSLPLPVRALKRLAWQWLQPNMHRFKRIWPRLVMPGGLIERHVAPLHYDINYHPVNVMDIVRLWRRHPNEAFGPIVDGAIDAVRRLDLLSYWGEAENRRFATVTWVEAMYQLCLFKPEPRYRQALAEAMLAAAQCGLGMPPALLGADAEAIAPAQRRPCPRLAMPAPLVANLSCQEKREFLLLNPTGHPLPVDWIETPPEDLTWLDANCQPLTETPAAVQPHSWVLAASMPSTP
ncbi:MAG: hypothetical protein ACUVSD_12115 [Thiobacillaceae bacterium]